MSLRSMLDGNTLFISALRLAILPALLLAACRLVGIDPFSDRCLSVDHGDAGRKYFCDPWQQNMM